MCSTTYVEGFCNSTLEETSLNLHILPSITAKILIENMIYSLIFSLILLILPFGQCENENCNDEFDTLCANDYHGCWNGKCLKCFFQYVDCKSCECTDLNGTGIGVVIGAVVGGVVVLILCIVGCYYCCKRRKR